MKPHLQRVNNIWCVFLSREHRDLVLDEIRRAVHDNQRRYDALTWGLTPEHAWRRAELRYETA